jgi:hypothetical protein
MRSMQQKQLWWHKRIVSTGQTDSIGQIASIDWYASIILQVNWWGAKQNRNDAAVEVDASLHIVAMLIIY